MRKVKRNNLAVSETLDTILLLGIAVALFSVLSFIVLTYPFEPSTPSVNIVGFVDGNDIILEHRGGEDLGLDTRIMVTINDSDNYVFAVSDNYILGNESKSNTVWNIGENIIINATRDLPSLDLSSSKVDLTVVDMNANSVILTGVIKEGSSVSYPDQYTLTINTVGSGTVDASSSGPYYDGDVVELTATADSGWHFVEWSGDLTGSTNPDSITIDGDKVVTATFTLDDTYTLTLTTSGTGSGTIEASPNGPYSDGATVKIWANASAGSTFAGFSGALSGTTTPQILTMDGDKSIDAQFTTSGIYTLTLRPNNNVNVQLNTHGSNQNWRCVDEEYSDGDSTYVYSEDDGSFVTDIYRLQDPSLSGTITKVTVYINVRRESESGAPTAGVSARTAIRLEGSSIEYGSITPDLSTSWTTYSTEYITKQGNLGSGSWTWDDIDDLEIGVSLRSQVDCFLWWCDWSWARCTQVWVEIEYTS